VHDPRPSLPPARPPARSPVGPGATRVRASRGRRTARAASGALLALLAATSACSRTAGPDPADADGGAAFRVVDAEELEAWATRGERQALLLAFWASW